MSDGELLRLGGAPAWMMPWQDILQQFQDSLGADKGRLEVVSPIALPGPASTRLLVVAPFSPKTKAANRDSLACQVSHRVEPLPD